MNLASRFAIPVETAKITSELLLHAVISVYMGHTDWHPVSCVMLSLVPGLAGH